MKKKYQNAFFIFGLLVLAIMLTQLDYREVWSGVTRAGYWFLAVVALWFFLYFFNTAAWWVIIKSQDPLSGVPSVTGDQKLGAVTEGATPFSFLWLYKITISGFALNYATPGGLMGGEPYRIMALAPKIGTKRATASVLLYVMTHIFSHFWFWLLACVLYICTQELSVFMLTLIACVAAFCLTAIWFFLKGYKRGIAATGIKLLRHIPFARRWARPFFEEHAQQLAEIDRQIAALHNQNPRTFVCAVGLELACRIASALEIFFILLVILPSANFLQCILILAFTSLFANMLFFIPLQLGGREGGFLMSVGGLGMTASAGIFVALLVRLRELIWTAIGLALIKFDKKT